MIESLQVSESNQPSRCPMDFLRQPASVLYKDEVLYRIGAYANVAQFVSFGTGLNKRFHRIRGLKDAVNQDLTYWVEELFKRV